jgi:hypothetical protein
MMERHYRVKEVSEMTGLSVPTIRKRLVRREVGYRKSVRAVMIPESEVRKLLGEHRPAIGPLSAA